MPKSDHSQASSSRIPSSLHHEHSPLLPSQLESQSTTGQQTPLSSYHYGEKHMKFSAAVLLFIQFFFLFLFGFFTDPNLEVVYKTGYDFATGYQFFTGVLIMMVVGFGYLMTFISGYSISAAAFSLLVTVIAFQWSIFTEAFFNQLYTQEWAYISIDIDSLLYSLYATAAVLISFGAIIGKVSPYQLYFVTIIELLFYSLNNQIMQIGVLNTIDCGGTIVIHMFGAFFGLSLSFMIGIPKKDAPLAYVNDVFSLIGTAFLWVYWPSFVAGALEPNSIQQQKATINTLLALAASSTTAFAVSSLLTSDGKFRPCDVQNGTLAGGVAVGAIANLTLQPSTVLLTGMSAGFISVFGFNKIQPWVLSKMKIHDSCGINNLHGMPSLIGGIASVIIAAYKNSSGRTSDSVIYGPNAENAWFYQFCAVFSTLFIAIVSGSLTGYLVNAMDVPIISTSAEYEDEVLWESAAESGADEKDN